VQAAADNGFLLATLLDSPSRHTYNWQVRLLLLLCA